MDSPLEIHVSEKIDGASLSITYVDGKLTSGVTRGDGIVGADVTPNVMRLNGVPHTIREKGIVTLRGEAVISADVFVEHFAPRGHKNARNSAAGLLNGRSEIEDLAKTYFIAYYYHGDLRGSAVHSQFLAIEHLRALGFRVPEISVVYDNHEGLAEFYEQYDSRMREKLPYRTDGLVLQVNHFEFQNLLPTAHGRPSWATAIKPSTTEHETTLLEVVWSQGLSGRYAPVARVTPTEIDGTTVQNVSLHNLDMLIKLAEQGLKIGAKIKIEKAGDIIPRVVGILN